MALWQAQLREEVAVPEIEAELAGKRSYFPLNQTIELTCAEATSHYNLLNCLPRRGFAQGRRAQAVDSVVLPLLRYSCCLSAGDFAQFDRSFRIHVPDFQQPPFVPHRALTHDFCYRAEAGCLT